MEKETKKEKDFAPSSWVSTQSYSYKWKAIGIMYSV